jgi:hypothetical protein
VGTLESLLDSKCFHFVLVRVAFSLVHMSLTCTYVVHYQAFNLALSQEHTLLLLGGGCERKLRVATLTSFSFLFKLKFSFY